MNWRWRRRRRVETVRDADRLAVWPEDGEPGKVRLVFGYRPRPGHVHWLECRLDRREAYAKAAELVAAADRTAEDAELDRVTAEGLAAWKERSR
jgi:hypothetical protein